ncbi:MAG: hypothetical protein ACLP1D_17485 [Xanthobacteraceae bacterium]
MSILLFFEPEGPTTVLAAVDVNLIVAFGLITLSLLLGFAAYRLAGACNCAAARRPNASGFFLAACEKDCPQ